MARSNLLLGLTLMLGGVALAASPREIFDQHQDAILTESAGLFEDYYFGTCAIQASTSAVGRRNAEAKAKVHARNNLLRSILFLSFEWPESVSPEIQPALEGMLLRNVTYSVTISNVSTFISSKVGGVRYAVATVPETSTRHLPRWTYEQAKEKLLAEEMFFSPGADLLALLAFHQACGEVWPAEIDYQPWIALLCKARFPGARLPVFLQLAGRYPLKGTGANMQATYDAGMAAFRQGDVADAYEAFLKVVEQTFAFDALNMAGNCARRIGKHPEAVALLLHAAYLKPESPYPWIHLAYVALAEGNRSLCEACYAAAEQRSPDNWTLQQLALLHTTLYPPPPPEPEPEPPAPEVVAEQPEPEAGTPEVEPAEDDVTPSDADQETEPSETEETEPEAEEVEPSEAEEAEPEVEVVEPEAEMPPTEDEAPPEQPPEETPEAPVLDPETPEVVSLEAESLLEPIETPATPESTPNDTPLENATPVSHL